MAGTGQKPLILVGGNMGRNDGVDYRAKLAAEFPQAEFISVEGQPEVLEQHIGEADAIIGDLPARLFAQAIRVRWVQTTGAGANGVTYPAIRDSEVIATSAIGVHVASVPEQMLAMMFAFARRVPEQILNQHGPHRFYWPTGMFEVEGQTMAILGLGKIGTSLAHKAKGLGMRVTGWRRTEKLAEPGLLDHQFAPDDLHGLLADADHVVITLPLTPETTHLIGQRELHAMKHSAYLYNVGRGPIIVQSALLAALKDGTIAGAGLDVTDPEPLPPDDPLWDIPNLILLTHYGGLTPKYGPRAYTIISDNVRRFLAGEPLMNVVDKHRGY